MAPFFSKILKLALPINKLMVYYFVLFAFFFICFLFFLMPFFLMILVELLIKTYLYPALMFWLPGML